MGPPYIPYKTFIVVDGKKIPAESFSFKCEPQPIPYKIPEWWTPAPAIMLPGSLYFGPKRVRLPGVPLTARLAELLLMQQECFERSLVTLARVHKMHVPGEGTWT